MPNLFDYLEWRGDLTFAQDPFHIVDALILAQLSYIPFDGIVPDEFDASVLLHEAAERFDASVVPETIRSFSYEQDCQLLKKLSESARFRDLPLSGYVSRTESEDAVQFAAVTVQLPGGACFLSYRGTDGSIAGWKEDFHLSFKTETPGQRDAAEYLTRCCQAFGGEIWTAGHSKGGNFAVYAAVFNAPEICQRVMRIYDFDSPGFRDEIAELEPFQEIKPKIVSVIPQSSLIGQLLTAATEHRIVKSRAAGLGQHLAYAWEIHGTDFVYAEELSKLGLFINRTVNGWLDTLDDTSRETLTTAVFDVIQASEKENFYEIRAEKLKSARAILRAMRNLTPEQRELVKQAIAKLAAKSKEALFPERKKPVRKNVPKE